MALQKLRGDHTQTKAAPAIGWPYVVSGVVGLATFIAGWMSTAWLDHSQLQSLQFGRLDYVSSLLIVLAAIATTAVLRLDLAANVVAVACAILGLVVSALGFDALASFGAVQDGTGIVPFGRLLQRARARVWQDAEPQPVYALCSCLDRGVVDELGFCCRVATHPRLSPPDRRRQSLLGRLLLRCRCSLINAQPLTPRRGHQERHW
jgi:hypothetical protein